MVLFQVKAAGLVQVFDLLTTPTFYRVILFIAKNMIDCNSNIQEKEIKKTNTPFHNAMFI